MGTLGGRWFSHEDVHHASVTICDGIGTARRRRHEKGANSVGNGAAPSSDRVRYQHSVIDRDTTRIGTPCVADDKRFMPPVQGSAEQTVGGVPGLCLHRIRKTQT